MSYFTWLDYSEQDRQRMMDVIRLFQEKDTRDELGLSRVRDAFSDMFFPGTSTIQTRARYFLFIPWIYQQLEKEQVPSREISQRARQLQVLLVDALIRGGESDGVIGIQARETLQRYPSSIYWNGLSEWGICLFPGYQGGYHHSLDQFYKRNGQISAENEHSDQLVSLTHNWHPGLPDPPPSLLRRVSFDLTPEEADYLRERLLQHAPTTLLAYLVDGGQPELLNGAAFPWYYPQQEGFLPLIREQLEHARNFSEALHGAALLYNLMLAEAARHEELQVQYQTQLQKWANLISSRASAFEHWDWPDRFWEIVRERGATMPVRTRTFIETWVEMILEPGQAAHFIAENQLARKLLSDREWNLKRKRARLHNPRALEMWNGAAGTSQLSYRWGTARTIINDILNGNHSPAPVPESEIEVSNA